MRSKRVNLVIWWLICAILSYGSIFTDGAANNTEWTVHLPSVPTASKDVTGCHFEGNAYSDGQRMAVGNPCIHCFCTGGKSKCFRQNCPPPPESCQLLLSNLGSSQCSSPSVYNCCKPFKVDFISIIIRYLFAAIPEKYQTAGFRKDWRMYGQRHHGSGFVQADCLIRGIAYLVGETVGVASSACLRCHCAKGSLLCVPLCCYEPIRSSSPAHRSSREQIEQSLYRTVQQRHPHPLEHLQ